MCADTAEMFKKCSIHFGVQSKSLHVPYRDIKEDVVQLCCISARIWYTIYMHACIAVVQNVYYC